jgi:hypothetical protein
MDLGCHYRQTTEMNVDERKEVSKDKNKIVIDLIDFPNEHTVPPVEYKL